VIRRVLSDGILATGRTYTEYRRAWDGASVFTTGFSDQATDVACLIEVELTGEADRYAVFSVSTAVRPHLIVRTPEEPDHADPNVRLAFDLEKAILDGAGLIAAD
jgi:hypothetical protein